MVELQENINLQITYHDILKMNIGLCKYESTSATCAVTNTQCCQSVIRNIVYTFVCTLDKSKNTIVKALLSSSMVYSSRVGLRAPWREMFYVHGVSVVSICNLDNCHLCRCAVLSRKYIIYHTQTTSSSVGMLGLDFYI